MAHREVIELNRHPLVSMIDVRHSVLWDELKARGLITDVAVESIKADYADDPRAQVGELLSHMQRRSPQDYQQFRQALIVADQEYVVQRYLPEVPEGERSTDTELNHTNEPLPPDEGDHHSDLHVAIIHSCIADLVVRISLKHTTLWDCLISKAVISMSDVQYLRESNSAERDQVRALLNYLCRRPYKDYRTFLEALKETRQGHVIQILKKAQAKLKS